LRATATITTHGGQVFALAFDHEGRRLATGHQDGSVRLWDAATGHALRTLRGHERALVWIGFAADDRTLLSTAEDGTVRAWDATRDSDVRRLGEPPHRSFDKGVSTAHSRAVAVDPSGELVAAATWNGRVL